MKKPKGTARETNDLMVVGIGASAGGLEALQDFFKNMPSKTGLAFVVIQHLSPDYKSLMGELLARYTEIPICVVEDGMDVMPDNIYLIPPRKNIVIFHDKLYLEDQGVKKGLNLPVDIFLRSLATDKGKNAIAVILSGTGSDGTLGIRAIKEAGGIVIVQDERSAKFDGMPKSSISTGLVDYILPAENMPDAIIQFIRHPYVKKKDTLKNIINEDVSTLTKIIIILRDFSGIDFSYYKENTLIRRLERRVSINRLDNLEDYLLLLSESDKEKSILNKELLIGVTRFFRDSEAFDAIRKKVFPLICEKKSVRIWSAGCSTGEEVYSLAILIHDYLERNALNCDVKIFATDIDRTSIEYAGRGYYPENILADVEPDYLKKYFVRLDAGYQVNETIRRMIVFATHNLLKDSPFSKLDLFVCRNLFIYLKPDVQARLLSMLYSGLKDGGYLFLGSSETIGDMGGAFECLDTKWKIYKTKPGYNLQIDRYPPFFRNTIPDIERSLLNKPRSLEGSRFENLFNVIMSAFLPPSIIVDSNDNIIHIINDVSPYVTLQTGRFSQNLMHNLLPEISLFVSTLLRKVKKEGSVAVFDSLIGIKGFENKKLTIEGREIPTERDNYYILSFKKESIGKTIPEKDAVSLSIDEHYFDKVSELEKELQFTKESLQATVEELETSNEELQSSNEELIASNEELQSTNEELQSVNEELYTVNSEYQIKIEELTRLNSDINNLLTNTEVGALYLDRKLCIRKITPVVSSITNILQSDIGRPITHLSLADFDNTMLEDIEKVVETLESVNKEIVTQEGTVYFVKIRPYRTDYNAVDGILITFIDISNLKHAREKAKSASDRLLHALEIGNIAWWEWDIVKNEYLFDERMAAMLGYSLAEFPKEFYKICELIHPDEYQNAMKMLNEFLEGKKPFCELSYRIKRKDHSYAWFYNRGEVVEKDENEKPVKIAGAVIDISRIKTLEEELVESKELFEKVLENSPVAKVMVNAEGIITYANKRAEVFLKAKRKDILNRSFNSEAWKITDLEGNPIPSEKLPFSIIKETGKPVYEFLHYIEVSEKRKILLNISGIPIVNSNGEFEGGIFSIFEVSNGKRDI